MKYVIWTVTFALCTSVWANAQTIADVARRERAKRQEPPRPRIATIEIVGKPAPPPEPPKDSAGTTAQPSASGAAAPSSNAADAVAATETKQDSRDETWWRKEFEKKRTDLRRGENQVAVAQLEVNAANRDFLTRSFDPDGRGPAAISAANAKLEAAQKYVDDARAALAQLEEDLRRSGAPAGWAR